MRLSLALIAIVPVLSFAQAKIEREGSLDPRSNQKIERIRIEDGGNRIDELRVGGQAQAITVQPKAPVPAYEILTDDLARNRAPEGREGMAGRRQRVWNVFDF